MLNYASAGLISRPGRELWSVPRLRGRGEQGNVVMHT